MNIVKKQNCDKYDPRFVIIDDEGEIIDDAQGFGYKTKQKAAKAMWYKFKNGKKKIEKKKQKINNIFKENPDLKEFIDEVYEINFKEIANGECSKQDIVNAIKNKFGIEFPLDFL